MRKALESTATSPPPSAGLREALEQIVSLIEPCTFCHGTGRQPYSDEADNDPCERCDGVGEECYLCPTLPALRAALAAAPAPDALTQAARRINNNARRGSLGGWIISDEELGALREALGDG